MDETTKQALANLLNGTASEGEIAFLQKALTEGTIAIGGNVNQSIIILGSKNTVQLTPEALDRLNGRSLLGNLDRDLTKDEINLGLTILETLLPERAPILKVQQEAVTRRLRATLGPDMSALSDFSRRERVESLATLNGLSMEVLDISFNGLCLGQEPQSYDSRSPFRGMESFRTEDAEFFFGREELTRKLIQKLDEHPFLAVLGASGSGKSSLVMAGLIPALGDEYIIFRPGGDPVSAIEKALEGGGKERQTHSRRTLIVVDQFEELFTLTRKDEVRQEFISHLLEFASSAAYRVVITLRADFLGEVSFHRPLKDEVESHQVIVPPMDSTELRKSMEGQAERVGLRFESDLSQQILDTVTGEPGAMPLLQHTLWILWKRRHGHWLRASEYRELGGVWQAIASTAEEVYGKATELERKYIRDIFVRLTRLDEGDEGRDTRQRVKLGELTPLDADSIHMRDLIAKLATDRLLIVNDDEVEVAHEALIRHWPRLRNWLNENRDALRLREGIRQAAQEWELGNKDASLLMHRGARLEEAVSIPDRRNISLNQQEINYLTACVNLQSKEILIKENRRKWVIASITAVLMVLSAVLGGWNITRMEARRQADEAKHQTQLATARLLLAQAQDNVEFGSTGRMISTLLGLESLLREPTKGGDQVIRDGMALLPELVHKEAFNNDVTVVTFSPNDMRLAIANRDGEIRIIDAETGKAIGHMKHDALVSSLAFSPDGTKIVSGSYDKTIRIWDVATGREIMRMLHDNWVNAVSISSNGKMVASASDDDTARIWDVETGREIAQVVHDGPVSSVVFGPDGTFIITGSWDYTARVWETSTGREIMRMTHNDFVLSVAVSPDGKLVASSTGNFGGAGHENSVRLWDAITGTEIHRVLHLGEDLADKEPYPFFVTAFSPDGRWLASAGRDGMLQIIETSTGRAVSQMSHNGTITSLAFSPDGNRVVTGSTDNSARIWETVTGEELTRMLHRDDLLGVAFSQNGRMVATASKDDTAGIWQSTTNSDLARMVHDSEVNIVTVSPDGKRVASGSYDNTARIWDIMTGQEISRMTHSDQVYTLAFSPDSKLIASGDEANTVILWEVETGRDLLRISNNDAPEEIVGAISFSPDGKLLVFGSYDGSARVWDISRGVEIVRVEHDDSVLSVAVSPDGKLAVSAGQDNTARIWEITTGTEVMRVSQDDDIRVAAFSPDGKQIATGGRDFTLRVWDVATGAELSRMEHQERVIDLEFSPDGKWVVSGSWDYSARVWEVSTGREISRMTHGGWLGSVNFSPDGRWVLSGSADGTARIWDARTGQEVARTMHDSPAPASVFSPDGRLAVSGSVDRTVRVWHWMVDDITSQACKHLPRNLTLDEWNRYVYNQPYHQTCKNLPVEE